MADRVRGRFVWHELMTTDTASAEAFYKEIVGWNTAPWGAEASYTLFMAGARPVAGLMVLPEEARNMGAPPHWLTYIGTANVDETAQRIVALGGRVLKRAEDIPNVGRFAIVQDPATAVFGLLAPAQSPTVDAPPGEGEFSWHELLTDDPSAAWDFYQQLFGWEKTSAMDMGPELGIYQMFGWSGQSVGGMFKCPPNVPAHWMPYAMLPDAKAAAKAVASLGGRIVNGPMEVPGGDWIAQGMDLQGVAFAVHSLKPAEPSAAVKPRTPKATKRRVSSKKVAKPNRKAAATRKKSRPSRKSPVRAKKKSTRAAPKPASRRTARRVKKPARRPATRTRRVAKRAGMKR